MSGRFVKKEPRTAKPKTGKSQVETAMRKAGYKKVNGQWIHKTSKQERITMQAPAKQAGQANTLIVLAVPLIVVLLCILILAN